MQDQPQRPLSEPAGDAVYEFLSKPVLMFSASVTTVHLMPELIGAQQRRERTVQAGVTCCQDGQALPQSAGQPINQPTSHPLLSPCPPPTSSSSAPPPLPPFLLLPASCIKPNIYMQEKAGSLAVWTSK